MTGRATAKAERATRANRASRGAKATGAAVALVAAAALLAVPAPAAAQSACGAGYTVRTGDSLLEIAERCGVTIPALLAVNPGVTDRMDLEVGDRLRVPSADDPQPSPQQACGAHYTVRTGDTLAEIAQKCGLTIPLIVAANGRLPDPLGLHNGMRIQIPDLPERAIRDTQTLVITPAVVEVDAESATAEAGAEVEVDVETEAEADTEAEGDADAPVAPELVRLRGELSAGDNCLLITTPDRGTFALVGRMSDAFRPGDRVVVMGLETESELCDHEPALEVRILYRDARP